MECMAAEIASIARYLKWEQDKQGVLTPLSVVCDDAVALSSPSIEPADSHHTQDRDRA